MTRIKGGLLHAKRRRGILKHTRGFKWGRKSKIKVAKVAKMKAGQHAFASRRVKKRINRGLWQVRINAAVRQYEISYSRLMGLLKSKKVGLDRKVLSEIARYQPEMFKKIVDLAKS
jgi:large subunit ribosomal protein L20